MEHRKSLRHYENALPMNTGIGEGDEYHTEGIHIVFDKNHRRESSQTVREAYSSRQNNTTEHQKDIIINENPQDILYFKY